MEKSLGEEKTLRLIHEFTRAISRPKIATNKDVT